MDYTNQVQFFQNRPNKIDTFDIPNAHPAILQFTQNPSVIGTKFPQLAAVDFNLSHSTLASQMSGTKMEHILLDGNLSRQLIIFGAGQNSQPSHRSTPKSTLNEETNSINTVAVNRATFNPKLNKQKTKGNQHKVPQVSSVAKHEIRIINSISRNPEQTVLTYDYVVEKEEQSHKDTLLDKKRKRVSDSEIADETMNSNHHFLSAGPSIQDCRDS